jgi:hypothetical protein
MWIRQKLNIIDATNPTIYHIPYAYSFFALVETFDNYICTSGNSMWSTFGSYEGAVSSSRSFITFVMCVLMASSILWCNNLCTSGSYNNMIMVSGATTSSLLNSRYRSLYPLYPTPKAEENSWKRRSAVKRVNPLWNSKKIDTTLLQVRGGGGSSTGSTNQQFSAIPNMNRIRVVPSTIPDSTSKTKSSSLLNPFSSSSTTTASNVDVKEQIDAFLTRDSRNTFIGMYGIYFVCSFFVLWN